MTFSPIDLGECYLPFRRPPGLRRRRKPDRSDTRPPSVAAAIIGQDGPQTGASQPALNMMLSGPPLGPLQQPWASTIVPGGVLGQRSLQLFTPSPSSSS